MKRQFEHRLPIEVWSVAGAWLGKVRHGPLYSHSCDVSCISLFSAGELLVSIVRFLIQLTKPLAPGTDHRADIPGTNEP